jgi:hypothetical protein
MAATAELKLTAASEIAVDSGAQAGTATATMAAAAGIRNYAQMAIISCNGNTPAAGRVTLTWTRATVAQTIGIEFAAAAFAPVVINFGNHPIEGDTNTAITLTVPTLGTQTEAVLVGFTRVE